MQKNSGKSYLKVAVLLLVLVGGGLLLSKNPSLNSGSFKKSSFSRSAPKLSKQTTPVRNNESTSRTIQSNQFEAPARTSNQPDSNRHVPKIEITNVEVATKDSNSVTLKVSTRQDISENEVIGFDIRRVKRFGNVSGFQELHSIYRPNWSRSSDGTISLKTGALAAGTEYAFSASVVYNEILNGVRTRKSSPNPITIQTTTTFDTNFSRAAGSSFYNRFVSDVSTLDDPTSSGRSIDLNCVNQGEHLYLLLGTVWDENMTRIAANCGSPDVQNNFTQNTKIAPTCPTGSFLTGIGGRFEHGDELNAVWPYCRALDTSANTNQIFSASSSEHSELNISTRPENTSFRRFGITCPDNKILVGMRLGGSTISDTSTGGVIWRPRNNEGNLTPIVPDISVFNQDGIDRLFGIHCADLVKTVR